ncbi:hypothetical protein BKA61DRAFT_99506 [Leptodontidium sp. MPI-SDFR-AT-0119]|nr:hypothetical protein BKA61DRAFT_99506 [Leptodontidium sp. MPI-SDFR-AT-0119]
MPSYGVVGASRGLGVSFSCRRLMDNYEWLRQLSSDPANTVIGLVRTPMDTEKRLVSDSIQNVHIVKADMADNDSLIAAAAQVEKYTGRSVDYLIINGIYASPDLTFTFPTEFKGRRRVDELDDTESKSQCPWCYLHDQRVLAFGAQKQYQEIAVISSGLGDRGHAEKSDMSWCVKNGSIKAALNTIVARYAAELKSEGIVVFALSPGLVDTMRV